MRRRLRTRSGDSTHARRGARPAWLLLLALFGCGSDDTMEDGSGGAPGGPGGAPAPLAGMGSSDPLEYRPCTQRTEVGSFAVRSIAPGDTGRAARTEIGGQVGNGVVPFQIWEEVAAEGDCRFSVGPELFCDPPCAAEEACAMGGECIPYPELIDVGTVRISGLDQEIEMTPGATPYYQPLGTSISYLPYATGAEIALSADGGRFTEPFVLRGRGVPEIELAPDPIVVESGEPVALRWTPGPDLEGVRIHVELDIAHHGGTLARIECEAEDSGALDIPAALVSQLVERGVAGFPAVSVARRSADSVSAQPGCVEFAVAAEVSREVEIPGVISCSADQPCPDGRACRADLTCE